MSSPESITVCLDMAKKLEKAGWPLNSSTFVWCLCDEAKGPKPLLSKTRTTPNDLAAPTAEEILRRLPIIFPKQLATDSDARLITFPAQEMWIVCYESSDHGKLCAPFQSDTLANAAAAMWIYLKANKLLPSA